MSESAKQERQYFVTKNEKGERLIEKPHSLDVRNFPERLLGIEM